MKQRLCLIFALVSFACVSNANNDSAWFNAEMRAQNAVVQVWAQYAEFNWLNPYKSPEQAQGAGSGFFISEDGYFLTNYHVVRSAKSVYVNVQEVGRMPLKATIVGVCPDLDVALLKLTDESRALVAQVCGKVNALEFGDSDAVYETQPILLLGYPAAHRTIKSTIGEVAGRDFSDGRSLMHITAPSTHGNSGGPALSIDGHVVGILCSGLVNAQNYNYIIPINDVLIVLADLYKTQIVRRPELQIGANRTTEAHARSLNNPTPGGLYINYVLKDSMEERAGLLAGDMIYEIDFNGSRYKVDEFGEVSVAWRKGQKIHVEELLNRCHIGDSLSLVIYRNGVRKVLQCAFENPRLFPVRFIYPEYEPEELDYEMIGGMIVMQLRENHLKIFSPVPQLQHLKEFREFDRAQNQSKNALIITSILAGSQAHLSECLSSGNILSKINGKTVTTLKELRDALQLSIQSKEIAIETKDKPSTVLNLYQVLEDEPRLSRDFVFPITDTVKKLMTALSNDKKTRP
jgi:serine protease Do